MDFVPAVVESVIDPVAENRHAVAWNDRTKRYVAYVGVLDITAVRIEYGLKYEFAERLARKASRAAARSSAKNSP
jgi:hypothetical protein